MKVFRFSFFPPMPLWDFRYELLSRQPFLFRHIPGSAHPRSVFLLLHCVPTVHGILWSSPILLSVAKVRCRHHLLLRPPPFCERLLHPHRSQKQPLSFLLFLLPEQKNHDTEIYRGKYLPAKNCDSYIPGGVLLSILSSHARFHRNNLLRKDYTGRITPCDIPPEYYPFLCP